MIRRSKPFYDKVAEAAQKKEFLKVKYDANGKSDFSKVKLSGAERFWSLGNDIIYIPALRLAGTLPELRRFLETTFPAETANALLNNSLTARNYRTPTSIFVYSFIQNPDGSYTVGESRATTTQAFFDRELSEIQRMNDSRRGQDFSGLGDAESVLQSLFSVWTGQKIPYPVSPRKPKSKARKAVKKVVRAVDFKDKMKKLVKGEFLNVTDVKSDGSGARKLKQKGESRILVTLGPTYPKAIYNPKKGSRGVINFLKKLGHTKEQISSVLKDARKKIAERKRGTTKKATKATRKGTVIRKAKKGVKSPVAKKKAATKKVAEKKKAPAKKAATKKVAEKKAPAKKTVTKKVASPIKKKVATKKATSPAKKGKKVASPVRKARKAVTPKKKVPLPTISPRTTAVPASKLLTIPIPN